MVNITIRVQVQHADQEWKQSLKTVAKIFRNLHMDLDLIIRIKILYMSPCNVFWIISWAAPF